MSETNDPPDDGSCLPPNDDLYKNDPSKVLLDQRAEIIRKAKEIQMTLVNTKDAAEILGVCKRTLDGWRCHENKGPPWRRVGKKVRYGVEDLRAWLEARKK